MSKYKLGVVLAFAVVMIVVSIIVMAQAPADATYKGSDTCKMCHSGVYQSYAKTGHSKAFADAGKAPTAVVAQFGDGSPITKDQIKYVLGSGIRRQAYMDANMQVLPAQWNVKEKKWETIPAADGSKMCIGCHVTGYDTAAKTWAQSSVGCESCHGPGSAHASTADKTKITNPKNLSKDKQAMVCGQCHSKGTDTTKTYAFPVKFRPGEDLTKTFIDAKPTTHGMNQQYSEMLGSKHMAGGIICTTCHDPHGADTTQPAQLKKPVNQLCLGCHGDKDMKTHAPGAPEGATCATCHMPDGSHWFKKPGS